MATEQMQDEIRQFFDHFRKMSAYFQTQLAPTGHYLADHELLAGKMACCALLDALSVARFPNGKPGRRFRGLVGRFGKYEYWNHVSIPQLHYRLERFPRSDHERLKKHAERCLARGQGYAIAHDPRCSELVKSFPESRKIIRVCRHLSLLYNYRCALVHELRQPGYGYEFEYTLKPCYQTQMEIPGDRLTFQLTYPLKFFFSLCDECINGLEQYFLRKEKSPFDAYESRFGDVWR